MNMGRGVKIIGKKTFTKTSNMVVIVYSFTTNIKTAK